jgi:DNA polymerase III epsilon subunit
MIRQVVIDTETTGLSTVKGRHRVVEIALVEIVNGKITGHSFQTRLNPQGRKSTAKALIIHRIKDSLLLNEPLFSEQLPDILKFIGDSELIFYNKEFDLEFMDNEAKLAGSDVRFSMDYKSICVFKMVSEPRDSDKWVSLDDACRMYGVDNSERTTHGALIDAQLTARVYFQLISIPKRVKKVPHKYVKTKPEPFPFSRAYKGYQLNYCYNTQCENYGVPPKFPNPRNLGKHSKDLGNYKIISSQDDTLLLHCKLCKTSTTTFSNKGIVQEVERLQTIYHLKVPSCPNTALHEDKRKGIPDGRRFTTNIKKVRGVEKTFTKLKPPCPNHDKDILGRPDLYWLDSKNTKKIKNAKGLPKIVFPDSDGKYHHLREAVSQTFKCKSCHTKFSSAISPQKGQHNSQLNYVLFSSLVNKVPINRIEELLMLSPSVIYARIEFFYNQCIQFEQFQLMKHWDKLKDKCLTLCMDRQFFDVNWTNKKEPRRTRLYNTSSVERDSRYVLGCTLNFDFTSNYQSRSKEFIRIGDYDKPLYKRRYQQYILPDERDPDEEDSIPSKKHLLVHQSYAIITHFEMLKPLLECVKKSIIYADNDNTFDIGITKVFRDLINMKKLQACIVRKSKLERGATKADKGYEWVRQETPVIDGKYVDLKALTDVDDGVLDDASISAVDSWFNQLRRRLTMVERPLQVKSTDNQKKQIENDLSVTGKFQKWNLYGSYNPKYVCMLIEISRVFNNFVLTDAKAIKNKRGYKRKPTTPAQRLGLVDEQFDIYDILEFSVANEVLKLKAV